MLQVVSNPSWMTPYVACMLVAIGMLAHFGTMLVRFLRRRADESDAPAATADVAPGRRANKRVANELTAGVFSGAAFWVPAITVALAAVYVCSKAAMPSSTAGEAQIYQFAKLPLAYEGRIKPFDTLARNTLQYLSGRQELGSLERQG